MNKNNLHVDGLKFGVNTNFTFYAIMQKNQIIISLSMMDRGEGCNSDIDLICKLSLTKIKQVASRIKNQSLHVSILKN